MHYAVIAECSHSRVLVVRVRAQGGMKWNDTAGDYRVRGLQWGV